MATKRDREVDPDEEMLSQVGRQKIKSRMYFVPGSCDTKKTLYLNFCEAIPTKLGMVIAYEKGTPSTMVTWHNSYVTNKKKFYHCFFMAHEYQTQQGDGLCYQATSELYL